MNIQHKNLDSGRWHALSLAEQLGNIGSEVGRALAWRRRGNPKQAERAWVRGFELIDLTLSGQIRPAALQEIARVREVVADFFLGENEYQSTPQSLENYFNRFALFARRHR